MKKWKIIYWLNSIRTEWIVKAEDEESAKEKFIEIKGDKEIIQISEANILEHN